jgi:glycerophosphoryl diester phosphodiesterase
MLSRLLSLADLSVIAHRGGSTLRPENTVAAFDHAVSLGVDALECDVHLSRDAEVVVIHDPTVDRTTNGSGPVAALTAGELARLDAGHHFGPADGHPFRGRGLGVPRLADLLARYERLPIVIELKGDDPAIAKSTVEVVRAAGAESRVVLAGFGHAVVITARRLAPACATGASRDEARAAIYAAEIGLGIGPVDFQLFQVPHELDGQRQFGRAFVDAARSAGLPVQAWIVDDPDDMRRLIDWGVTGIISDRPDRAIQVRAEQPRDPGTSRRSGDS